jgi:hypothetical protein
MNPPAGSLFVFSHPNHEFAVFGMLQRFQPWLVYLTDGGGEQRTAQTRQALAEIGLLSQATFLDYSETSFYDALLRRDADFFAVVADKVRERACRLAITQVLCDAVELYNPVHDMALPVVRAALGDLPEVEIFEVPLVYQPEAEFERFVLQRFPASRGQNARRFTLTEKELATKLRVYSEIYEALATQMGTLISALPPSHLGLEEIAPAIAEIWPRPAEQNYRYDRRGQMLLARGEVKQNITFRDHYLPIACALGRAELLSSESR